jgi:hypothetical protein
MPLNLVEIVAQYGVLGSLLFAVMYWLVKHFLPEQQRQHRAELESILIAHNDTTSRLANAVERNTRVVQFNSQALLVQSLIRGGLNRQEAEQIADSIRLSSLNGLDPTAQVSPR